MEKRFRQKRMDVRSTQAVQHPATFAARVDEAGEAEFREVLARDWLATSGGIGERGDVLLAGAKRPKHAYPRRIS